MNNLDLSKYQNYVVGEKHSKGEPRTIREEIVVKFMDRLNEDRTQEKNLFRYREWLKEKGLRHSVENINTFAKSKQCYKPLSFAFVARLLVYYNNHDKHILFAQCSDARCFSACFWSKIKK